MQQTKANSHQSGLYLCFAVAVAVLLTSLIYTITQNKREQTNKTQLKNQIEKLLPTRTGNSQATIDINTIEQLITPTITINTLYRYAGANSNTGVVLHVTSDQGYSGDITILIAINENDRIGGVAIGAHTETPGLGDRIEAQHSDWLSQFDQLKIGSLPTIGSWRVKKDGGQFDQITGATVTPRAVVHAVGATALWFIDNRATLEP